MNQRKLFGLVAVALFAVGAVVLQTFATGEILNDAMLLFAGGSLSSAFIAFEHWRTGELINVWAGIELVRCTRGHTVNKESCTAVVGKLVCPICECRIPGYSPDTGGGHGD